MASLTDLPADVIPRILFDPMCARELACTCRRLSDIVPRRIFAPVEGGVESEFYKVPLTIIPVNVFLPMFNRRHSRGPPMPATGYECLLVHRRILGCSFSFIISEPMLSNMSLYGVVLAGSTLWTSLIPTPADYLKFVYNKNVTGPGDSSRSRICLATLLDRDADNHELGAMLLTSSVSDIFSPLLCGSVRNILDMAACYGQNSAVYIRVCNCPGNRHICKCVGEKAASGGKCPCSFCPG